MRGIQRFIYKNVKKKIFNCYSSRAEVKREIEELITEYDLEGRLTEAEEHLEGVAEEGLGEKLYIEVINITLRAPLCELSTENTTPGGGTCLSQDLLSYRQSSDNPIFSLISKFRFTCDKLSSRLKLFDFENGVEI